MSTMCIEGCDAIGTTDRCDDTDTNSIRRAYNLRRRLLLLAAQHGRRGDTAVRYSVLCRLMDVAMPDSFSASFTCTQLPNLRSGFGHSFVTPASPFRPSVFSQQHTAGNLAGVELPHNSDVYMDEASSVPRRTDTRDGRRDRLG